MKAVKDKVCFNPRGFEILLESLQDTYKSAGCAMIFQMSRKYGEYLVSEMYPLGENESDDILGATGERFRVVQELGWGEYNIESYDPEKGVLMVYGKSTLPIINSAGKETPLCFFIKGALVGAVESIMNMDFSINLEEYIEGKNGGEFRLKLITENIG